MSAARDGTTVGVVGSSWRATVSSAGRIEPWDGTPALDWWIAADDRWHEPSTEPSTRQQLAGGAPVVETVVRVPEGDALHRTYAVPDGGGLTVVQIENRSRLPFAVAFSTPVLSTRAPADVPVQGISLPPATVLFPVAHGTSFRVALAHDGRSGAGLPPVPDGAAVARGWLAQTEVGARFDVADEEQRLVATRAALLLEGPPSPEEPDAFLLGVRELVRLGANAKEWVDDVAAAVAIVAATMRHRPLTWLGAMSLAAASEVLGRAGERHGVTDVAALRGRLGPAEPRPAGGDNGVARLAWIEDGLVRPVPGGADLLAGVVASWPGQALAAHDVPVAGGRLSLAVRWHGEHPALLWESSTPMRLTARACDPSWTTTAPAGEVLLRGADRSRVPRP